MASTGNDPNEAKKIIQCKHTGCEIRVEHPNEAKIWTNAGYGKGWKKTEECKKKLEIWRDAGYAGGHINVGAYGGVTANAAGVLEIIDTFDRPGDAFAKGAYAYTEEYAVAFKDEPGQRLPKAGVGAAAGIGHARAEWSVFEAEAKGPNACAGAVASVASLGAEAFARAEVGSASASAGPIKLKAGLAADTGISIGATGLEAKVLGTGITIGEEVGISLFGSEIKCSLL